MFWNKKKRINRSVPVDDYPRYEKPTPEQIQKYELDDKRKQVARTALILFSGAVIANMTKSEYNAASNIELLNECWRLAIQFQEKKEKLFM